MKISRKLSSGFSVILLLILLVTASAVIGFNRINKEIDQMHSNSIPLLVDTNAQSSAALAANSLQKDFLYADTVEKRNIYKEATLAKSAEITNLITGELEVLSKQPESEETTLFIEQAEQIQTSIREYENNIALLSEELNKKTMLDEQIAREKKNITDIIEQLIDRKYTSSIDTIKVLDALKEINIAQLRMRILTSTSFADPVLYSDTPKKITPYSNIIMEQLDILYKYVSDDKHLDEIRNLVKEVNEYSILVNKFYRNETSSDPDIVKTQNRVLIKNSIIRLENNLDDLLHKTITEWSKISSDNSEMLTQLSTLKEDTPRIESILKKYLETENEKSLKKIGFIFKALIKNADKLQELCTTTSDSTSAESLSKYLKSYNENLFIWLNLKLKIEKETNQKLNDITQSVASLLAKKVTTVEEAIDTTVNEMHTSTSMSLYILYIATGVAFIIGIALSIILIRNITRPITTMSDRLVNLGNSQNDLASFLTDNLSNGDWSEYCEINISEDERKILNDLSRRKDEIGAMSAEGLKMSDSFSKCIEATNTVIRQVNYALNKVSSTVVEVAKNSQHLESQSQELADGATKQASSLEEITSSLQDMSHKVDQNASGATQARDLSAEANIAGSSGTDKMNELVEKMQEINSATNEITKIIKTIDDIAFQTNLLALNAAVEAARAGTHGKGFAVVAEEVRNLAARSAKAAGETGTLIENVVNQINSGNNMVGNTAEVLSEIVKFSQQVTTLSSEVADASTDQAVGITQINKSLALVDDITQHNAANAEETASSSQVLNYHANTLQNLTEKFTLMVDEETEATDFDAYELSEPDMLPNETQPVQLEYSAETPDESDQIILDDQEWGD